MIDTMAIMAIALVAMAFMFFQQKRQEKHLTGVLDRFLSRHFQEYSLSAINPALPEAPQNDGDKLQEMDDEAVNWVIAEAKKLAEQRQEPTA